MGGNNETFKRHYIVRDHGVQSYNDPQDQFAKKHRGVDYDVVINAAQSLINKPFYLTHDDNNGERQQVGTITHAVENQGMSADSSKNIANERGISITVEIDADKLNKYGIKSEKEFDDQYQYISSEFTALERYKDDEIKNINISDELKNSAIAPNIVFTKIEYTGVAAVDSDPRAGTQKTVYNQHNNFFSKKMSNDKIIFNTDEFQKQILNAYQEGMKSVNQKNQDPEDKKADKKEDNQKNEDLSLAKIMEAIKSLCEKVDNMSSQKNQDPEDKKDDGSKQENQKNEDEKEIRVKLEDGEDEDDMKNQVEGFVETIREKNKVKNQNKSSIDITKTLSELRDRGL